MNNHQYTIEGTLCPNPQDSDADFKADIRFAFLPGAAPLVDPVTGGDPGWEPEIDIVAVTPIGCVAPITEDRLFKLAYDWLEEQGGYFACCQHVEERKGEWE